MTAKELSSYELQTVKTCIQTYINLYGVMPGAADMVEWLGESCAKIVPLYITELTAA